MNGRLGLHVAVWLQRKFGMLLRLNAGLVCDDSAAEAAYAACGTTRVNLTLPLQFYSYLFFKNWASAETEIWV